MERPLAIACRREVASMRVKSTRLNDVIETAILFLYLPIQPNPSFPSVVQHPFTNAPISALNVDGSMRMLDLMKPDDLQLWQKEMEQVIRKITDPMLLLSRISKGYRLAFIKYVNDYLSIEDLSRLLRFAWRSVEFPNRDPNFSHSQLCQLFRECPQKLLMHKEELAAYNKLPKTIHIYRGVTSGKEKDIMSLSWTTDHDMAVWFSKRFGNKGFVCEADIAKEDILTYWDIQGESEVIVDPRKLQNVREELIETEKPQL